MRPTIMRNECHGLMIYIRWFMGDKFIIFGVDFNCIDNKNIDKVVGNDVYGDVGTNILGTI